MVFRRRLGRHQAALESEQGRFWSREEGVFFVPDLFSQFVREPPTNGRKSRRSMGCWKGFAHDTAVFDVESKLIYFVLPLCSSMGFMLGQNSGYCAGGFHYEAFFRLTTACLPLAVSPLLMMRSSSVVSKLWLCAEQVSCFCFICIPRYACVVAGVFRIII